MNQFLIPANTKRGQLILSAFRPIDLAILIIGCVITLGLFLAFEPNDLTIGILILSPALICAFLVLPVPNYHNMMCILINIYKFYLGDEKNQLVWKGWCVKDEYQE